jgi:hypothetical protein
VDLLAAMMVYLLSRIIENWPTTWQTRVLLLGLLILLVLLGFFGLGYWTPAGPARVR